MSKPVKKSRIRHPVIYGGPGSGNFGHAGRPGAVGGSGGGGAQPLGHFSQDDFNSAPLGWAREHYFGTPAAGALNAWLRGSPNYRDQDMAPIRDKMDQAFKDAGVKVEAGVVYRGIGGRSAERFVKMDRHGPHLKEGEVITDKGFVSTTTIKSHAENFATLGWPLMMKIEVPAGTTVLKHPRENEILLNRDSHFRVKSLDIKDGQGSVVVLELLHSLTTQSPTTQADLTQSTPKLVPSINIYAKLARVDPTKTLVLRNNFVAQMTARFRKLKAIIKKAIIDDDCFGIAPPESQGRRIVVQADLTTRGGRSFNFPTSQQKSAAFLEWLRTQEQAGILETVRIPQVGTGIDSNWTDVFIKDSYQRGVQRARDELLRGKYAVPSMEVTGGISASMMQPFHIDRLGVCYSRVYDGLKGITSAMDTQISHVLTKGLADGDSQHTIAKKLLATIDGNNAGTLGLTDSLGRFIPAERRAAMLARTEIIRSHHLGMVQELRNWAVAGVTVVAEWHTAGFNVCPICAELQGKRFTLDEVQDMLPRHPHCRCCIIPIPVEKEKVLI